MDRNSLGSGQCYLLWCNFANNSTQGGQYYVISGSKIVALIEVSVTYYSVTLKKIALIFDTLNECYFLQLTNKIGTYRDSVLARPYRTKK